MKYKKRIGRYGEDFAAMVLDDMGYRVVDRNFETKMGEIDLVAYKDGVLHFVEVKTRTQTRYGYPAESVTDNKLNHMKKAAQIYIQCRKPDCSVISFDVMEVLANMISDCA